MSIRTFLVGLAAAVTLGVAAPPAHGQVDSAALSATDVFVDPAAGVAQGDTERLTAAARDLRQAGTPTKFVVLARRPVNPPQLAQDLRRALGFNGNVLVLSQSPRSLGIGSGLPGRSVEDAFRRSLPRLQADPVNGTIAVAQRLAGMPADGTSSSGAPAGRSGGRSPMGSGLLVLLLPFLLGGVALMAFTRRAARRQVEVDVTDQRAGLEPMVDALAAHISELDTDLRLGGDRAAQAQRHYDEAVLAYGEVRDAMASTRRQADLTVARDTLERGLRAAQAARAVLDGRPPPRPEETPLLQGLCTFDPKHGRAVRKMKVVTPSGDEASVPVCARCAEGLSHGDVPEVRRVARHGEPVPYWEAASGVGFGGSLLPMFGGLFGGMLVGSLLSPGVTIVDDGDIGGFGGGDFGGGFGGDFGGGDF